MKANVWLDKKTNRNNAITVTPEDARGETDIQVAKPNLVSASSHEILVIRCGKQIHARLLEFFLFEGIFVKSNRFEENQCGINWSKMLICKNSFTHINFHLFWCYQLLMSQMGIVELYLGVHMVIFLRPEIAVVATV